MPTDLEDGYRFPGAATDAFLFEANATASQILERKIVDHLADLASI
jgi:hypothetical protein